MFLIEDIHSPINLFPLYSAILVPTSVIPSLYPQCLNRQLTISRVDETSLLDATRYVLYPKSAALPACRHRRERRAPKMPRPTTSAT